MVRRMIMTGIVAATMTLGLAVPASAAPHAADLLWSLNTNEVAPNFEGVEEAPGTVTDATDPLGRYGPSLRYETWANANGYKARCESRGLRASNGTDLLLNNSRAGQTFYLGWRALWDPMPIQKGAWISLFQLHVDGISPGQPGAGPFVLRTLGDGTLHFQLTQPNGTSSDIWTAPLSLNKWNSFVIRFTLSRTDSGSVSFWYDGKPQTLSNGKTSIPAATLWGDHVNVKWGVYRSGANHTGHAVAYLNDAKFGTTYAAVAPTG